MHLPRLHKTPDDVTVRLKGFEEEPNQVPASTSYDHGYGVYLAKRGECTCQNSREAVNFESSQRTLEGTC